MAEIKVTSENFESEVLKSEKPVLIDFWATWCGPCKMLAPVLAEIAEEHPEIVVGKINVDEEMELAQQFKVASIPTVMLVKNGEVVETSIGFKPKAAFEDMLK